MPDISPIAAVKLLPCAHCGSQANIHKRKTVMVCCSECTASTFQVLDEKESAITAWNLRASIEQPTSEVVELTPEQQAFQEHINWLFAPLGKPPIFPGVGASPGLNPEYKAAQRVKNVKASELLDAIAGAPVDERAAEFQIWLDCYRTNKPYWSKAREEICRDAWRAALQQPGLADKDKS